MFKLKEIILDVLKELDLTPDDLKKFNKIMKGKVGVKNSIHTDTEEPYKTGFGYGGPSSGIYGKKSPDRPYRSDKDTVGGKRTKLTPQI